jgi:hypothetical protein
MKLVLSLLVIMFAFTTINAADFDQFAGSKPVLVAENKYVCSKPLKYTDSDGAIKEDKVFFIFEKLTYRNLKFWVDYTRQQKEGADLKDSENPELKLSEKISEGLDPLIGSMMLFTTLAFVGMTEETPETIKKAEAIGSVFEGSNDPEILHFLDEVQQTFPYDIWMSYSTRKDPSANNISNEDIEMVMSVFAKHGCPFTSHVGISKNYLFFLPESLPHKEIGMQLHASAMVTVEQIYGHGVHSHMITRPTPLMAGLMAKKLISGESVWINCDMAYAQRTYYIHTPAHSHDRFPLDNRDPNTWKLAVSEHVRIFPRPLWFPHDGYTGPMSGEHKTLGNTYFTVSGVSSIASPGSTHFAAALVAVSGPALSEIWYKPVDQARGL